MRYNITPRNDVLSMEMQLKEYIKIFNSYGLEIKEVDSYDWFDSTTSVEVHKDSTVFRILLIRDIWRAHFYFCKQCGNETEIGWNEYQFYIGDEDYDIAKKINFEKELRQLSEKLDECHKKIQSISYDRVNNPSSVISKCPCCDMPFTYEQGYYMYLCGGIYKKQFKMMPIERNKNEERAVKKELDELLVSYSNSCESGNISNEKNSIKESSVKLIEYVDKLIKIESNIHFLKERIPQLYIQRLHINRKVMNEKYTGLYELKCEAEKAESIYEECIENYRQCTDISKTITVPFCPPVRPNEPVYEIPKFFNKKRVAEANELLKNQYEHELEEYYKQLEIYKKDKETYIQELRNNAEKEVKNSKEVMDKAKASVDSFKVNREMTLPTLELKLLIDEEIEKAETNLKQFLEVRDKMYMLNVVFSKYRNLVALTTFYEYLVAGRCSKLEGADGAYNLYESEIRMNMISSQLSEVIDRLEQIQQTQQMMYIELKGINSKLDSLNEKMNTAIASIQSIEYNSQEIVRTNEMIAYNTAVTAHYSKMTAEYTNALGYLVALK